MKALSILIGLVLFSIGLSLMFSFAGDVFNKHDVDDDGVFSALAVEYEDYSNSQTKDGSDIRNVADAAKQGPASSETEDVRLLTGAIQGGRLIINSISNFDNIAHNVSNTINKGDNSADNYVDRRIINTAIILVVLIIVIISIQFLRGFKFET